MKDREAIAILLRLLEKPVLTVEEQEAVRTAIGILSWSKLGESRLKHLAKAQKAKKEKMYSRNS